MKSEEQYILRRNNSVLKTNEPYNVSAARKSPHFSKSKFHDDDSNHLLEDSEFKIYN